MLNLNQVVKFELIKQVRKKSFWISIFIFPLMMVIFGGVGYLNVKLSKDQDKANKDNIITKVEKHTYKIAVADKSSFINQDLIKKLKLSSVKVGDKPETDFADNKDIDALIVFERDIKNDGYTKYIRTNNPQQLQELEAGVGQLSRFLISESVNAKLDPTTKQLVKGEVKNQTKIYDNDGKSYDPLKKMIVPGIFAISFFLIFMMSGNQMLTAVTEEKENRVAEMILTSVQGKTLIFGKIIALIITSIIRLISIIVPLIIFYFVARNFLDMPPFISQALNDLIFEFWPVFFATMFLIFGFLMITSVTLLIGALFPTAQEAGQFFGFIILLFILPIYFSSAILSGSDNLIIQILSYFPTSSTMTMMLRNMTGNLSITEGFIGLAITIIFTFISINLAVRAFKSGLFEYSKKLSLKSLFRK